MFGITSLQPEHASKLGIFFTSIAEEKWFQPHALTVEAAEALTAKVEKNSKDTYLVALFEEEIIAYGMLRGWDEGYEIPSLGISVAPTKRGHGIGKAMMECLHCIAKLRDAPAIRLTVHPENVGARLLYANLGYLWQPQREAGRLVGILKLHRV